ncbi:MAG: hypothetical protein AAF483_22145 [Planctomycetota bacterium]
MIEKSTSLRRSGFQLIELIVSLSSASLIVAGTATSIYLASQSQNVAQQSHVSYSTLQESTNRLRTDLAEMKSIVNKESTAITFTVPDRNGDGIDETIYYRWDGYDNPLQYSEDNDTWWNLTTELSQFELNYRNTAPQSSNSIGTFDPSNDYLYRSYAQISQDSDLSLQISIPSGYQSGDLLLASVVVENRQNDSIINASSDWTKLGEAASLNEKFSLAVFYTFTTSNSIASFSWTSLGHSQAAVVHFDAPSASSAYDNGTADGGISNTPLAPSVNVSSNNSLLIRLLAAEPQSVINESTNMPGHLPIVLRSDEDTPLLGLVHRRADAGDNDAESFHLQTSLEFITASIVFTP